METDTALMTSGYLLARLGIIGLIGYALYQVMRQQSWPVRVRERRKIENRPDARREL